MTGQADTEAHQAFHRAVTREFADLERNRSWRTVKRANATAAAVKRITDAAVLLGMAMREDARNAHKRTLAEKDRLHGEISRLDQQNRDLTSHVAELTEQLAELQPKLGNAQSVRDALRDELTDVRAELQGQLAIAKSHQCEPLPQRVSHANASIREGLNTAPEPKPATGVAPQAAARPPAGRKARSAGTGKTGSSQAVRNDPGAAK